MLEETLKLKEELSFDNLYNYFYQIYLMGEYRDIRVDFTDWEGSKYITVSFDRNSDHVVRLYEVMNEGTPLEERKCIRYFDEEGDYSEDINLKKILELFNKFYSSELRDYHVVGEVLKVAEEKEIEPTITLTASEIETLMDDVDKGVGWSDSSYKIITFLGKDPSDGV
jgi:hypothetical protein